MTARKAKSQSKLPSELMSQQSSSQGKKRRKTSDDTARAKKRRTVQGQTSPVEAEYVPSANDLISDVPRDENFTIDTLLPDLGTSYVDRFKSPTAPARAKRKPWPRQASPLIDPEKLPPGWSMTEPDLNRDDIEAQIERCHVRIRENIMPHIFAHRLKGLQISRVKQNELAESEPGNHSLDVLRRLEILREMEIELQGSDNFNQLPNVLALLQAYRGGMLDWNIGLVTYWFEGVQLCEPRPFSWDEFEVLNAHHSGKTGFWMEGLVGPGPTHSLSAVGIPANLPNNAYFARSYMVALRIPGLRWYAELEFVYDTGASMMSLFEGDLQNIMGRSTVGPTVMGLNSSSLADGSRVTSPTVELEVTILDTNRMRMTGWTRVQAQVSPGSAPRDNDMLWIANTHPELVENVPDTGHSRRRPVLTLGTIPLDPAGQASVTPGGSPGPTSRSPPVLRRGMPRAAP
ncbi:hypothetical protein LT330_006846 [Penicillium expansum]|nr:hypothetical protein LT330_006846 [Penicillium expansum]